MGLAATTVLLDAVRFVDAVTIGTPIIVAVIVGLFGLLSVQIQQGNKLGRKAAVNSETAATNSVTAAAQTKATGNGYAADSLEKLDRILVEVDGLRTDHRELARRVQRTSERLDRHLDARNTR